jgi:hypothetical protein
MATISQQPGGMYEPATRCENMYEGYTLEPWKSDAEGTKRPCTGARTAVDGTGERDGSIDDCCTSAPKGMIARRRRADRAASAGPEYATLAARNIWDAEAEVTRCGRGTQPEDGKTGVGK